MVNMVIPLLLITLFCINSEGKFWSCSEVKEKSECIQDIPDTNFLLVYE